MHASVLLQIRVLCVVTSCRLLNGYRRFGELQCLRLHCQAVQLAFRTSLGPTIYKNLSLYMWLCVFGRVDSDVSEDICLFLRYLDCLTLKMKATPSYETPGTATPPTGCHIRTAVRTSNLIPHNYLRLAQCNIPEEANLRERLKSKKRSEVSRSWRSVLRSCDVWRHVVIRYMKTDVSGKLIVSIFRNSTCQN